MNTWLATGFSLKPCSCRLECTLSISSLPEIFPHPNHVVPAPRAVGAEVGRTQVPVTGSKPAKEEMLGDAHFEAFPHVDSSSPSSLHPDRVNRPGVKRPGKIPAKQELRFSKEKESLQLAPAERAQLHIP